MTEISDLTRELVAVPSHADETAVGDRIERWLAASTDAEIYRDEVGNVIARRGSGPGSLALVGHHDVVPPAEQQVDGDRYAVEERAGRIYGRGAADMKGAVAAAMCAFRDARPAGELVFASFVGEETGGRGARHAIENGFRVDYAVVGEGSTNYSKPGVTDVVIAHRGRRGSTAIATGRSCHASEPERGENAIYRACVAVDRVRAFDAPAVETFGNELAGSVTVTGIHGGSAENVVPDRCEITIDERTVPGSRLPLDRLTTLPGIEWRVDQDLPPMRCDDERFADEALSVADVTQDGTPELVSKPHATDAGWLAEAGISCIVCGPSEPGEAHTTTESVDIDVLERCYRIYRGLAERATDDGRR